ncbi:uncharacterized protein LOC141854115 [Brevipalpus obovatus]|uniref:uncharacterized protein LOC141854115 n=1 Tax=Brevipalpus obovatus TaxID=246614 RepID=UPI003D9F2B2F
MKKFVLLALVICALAIHVDSATINAKEAIIELMTCMRQQAKNNGICLGRMEHADYDMFKLMFDGFEHWDDLEGHSKDMYKSELAYFAKRYLMDDLESSANES